MKKFSINWKNMLAGVALAGMFACSGEELEQTQTNVGDLSSRNVLVTKTVTMTETTDSLELILQDMMGDEVSTLQKLVVSGPFTAADMGYIRNSLPNLEELDLKDALIRRTAEVHAYSPNDTIYDDAIASSMFEGMSNLKQIVLPTTITRILHRSFYDCKNLIAVEIPAAVEFIGDRAFWNCYSLTSVILNQGLETIWNYAFYNCRALSSIEIPETVKSIGQRAFSECEQLVTIKLNQGLKDIGNYAFSYCESLADIQLPDGLETIGENAFAYCSSLTTMNVPNSVTSVQTSVFAGCTALNSVSIMANLTELPNSTFDGCTSLEAVELPSTIETIGGRAFYNCTNFTNHTLFGNVKTIGNYAFYGCGFTEFDLSGVESLGSDVFVGCRNLQEVIFPNNLIELPDGIFRACTSLTNVSLPSTLEIIGDGAFLNSGLTDIEIPASVTTIKSSAFYGSQLKKLTIPATVTSVGSGFVSNCSNLIAVFWNSSIEVPYSYNVDDCFLYLSSGNNAYHTDSWRNVIFDGVAENIVLNIDGYKDASQSYGCLQAFTAKRITYNRRFSGQTIPGTSSGWQTIVLPFKPTSITHESKGVIAPFNSTVEGAKPFWLRELTSEGWKDVTSIEPNKGYIIAMPNYSEYLDDYCLNGTISFSAENVQIDVTPATLTPSVGPEYELQPTYQKVAKAANVYALNDGVFARSTYDVYPYNAYVKTLGGNRSARSVFSMDTRSSSSRAAWQRNITGIPQIGDM